MWTPSAESEALRCLPSEAVDRAFAALPPDWRLVVLLADVEELSYREIAEVMGIPLGTVMSRLHRARKRLQEQLGNARHSWPETAREERMTHHDAWELLDEFLDGALAADARWAVAAHLEECAVCRTQVATQARLRGLVRERLTAIEPPPGLTTRLASALATEAMSPTRRCLATAVTAPRPMGGTRWTGARGALARDRFCYTGCESGRGPHAGARRDPCPLCPR